MAAPNKIGLNYFSLDVDFFEDEKILAISGEFAVKGEIITLRLLCEIYRNGYFVEYTELLKNKLARLGGLSGGLVDEVTNKLVKYNFFNEVVFREHKILTSKAIQKRYLEATKRRKHIHSFEFWLLNEVNVNINDASSDINVNIYSQSKVKESKVNKKKSIKEKVLPPPLSKIQKIEERKKREKEFYAELIPFVGQFTKEMIREFYDHWSEPNKSGTKMKWEMQDTWDLSKRLARWQRNDDKWNSKPLQASTPKEIKKKSDYA